MNANVKSVLSDLIVGDNAKDTYLTMVGHLESWVVLELTMRDILDILHKTRSKVELKVETEEPPKCGRSTNLT